MRSSAPGSGKIQLAYSVEGVEDAVNSESETVQPRSTNWTRCANILILVLALLTLGGWLVSATMSTTSEPLSTESIFLLAMAVLSMGGLFVALLQQLRSTSESQSVVSSTTDEVLKMFVEKNPEIMFVKNLDSSFAVANEKFHEMVSDPSDILSDINRDDDLPGFVASRIHQQDLQVIRSEEPMEFHSEYHRDGQHVHLKTLRFPIYDSNDELIAIGGISSDVTDQVRSRRALMENEQLLRTFIESAPDAVLICGESGDVTLVNKAAEIIFGFDRSEMLGMSLFDLVMGINTAEFSPEALAEQVYKHSNVAVIRQGSGKGKREREFPVEYSLAPVSTAEGSLVICTLRDVSEKAAIETQLRQSQKMEAIGKLTGGMAHDFNNLLGIIIGNLALAKRKLDAHDPLIKRLDTALNAAERGAELTKRMLAVAQRQALQLTPMDLNDIVREMAKMLPQTLGSDIEIKLDLTEGMPAVAVDKSAAESVLLNLGINARDAMPQGGTFTVRTLSVTQKEIEKELPNAVVPDIEFIHVAVSDTGTGMSQEALNRAFEPFFTTKEKGKGTGLGLSMIYGFVKQSSGYIVLDSVLGQGTTVNIYLPTCSDSTLEQHKPGGKIDVPFLAAKAHTVLIVDDEVDLLEIATAYLEDLGCRVLTAEGGPEALEILGARPDIELLLTDVVMPKMNGVVLAEKASELRPGIAVLYASGYPSGTIQEKSGTLLDAPLVHKPYTRDKLAEAVLEVLAQREVSA